MHSTPPIFRWAVWNIDELRFAMLKSSIQSVKYFYGSDVEYVVFTDEPMLLTSSLSGLAHVRHLGASDPKVLCSPSTWRKWLPSIRLDPCSVEIYLDIDYFLVARPVVLDEFISGRRGKFLVANEDFSGNQPYGIFVDRIGSKFVAVNAGLLGQHVGCSLERDYLSEMHWWHKQERQTASLYHDEQGAIAFALQRHIQEGSATILDKSKYPMINSSNLDEFRDLSEICGFHATEHEHPAYWKLRKFIPGSG